EEGSDWKLDDPSHPKRFQHAGGQAMHWLRYSHIMRESKRKELITDFMGYNTGKSEAPGRTLHWVGDLMLECDVTVDKATGDDELRFEICKGVDRFQARFQPATGKCTLVRQRAKGGDEELDSKQTSLKGPGNYRVRIANFDERLTVWVDGELP